MADDVEAEIIRRYERWSGPLVGYAMAYTRGDVGEAEVWVDEAFHLLYQQWNKRADFNEQGLYGWLQQVVRNRAIGDYRKRRRIVLVDPLEDGHLLDQPCAEDDPVLGLLVREHTLLARDLVDRCMVVIHGMPEHLRIAILLRGEGQTSSQIGAQMGVDSSTVRGYWKKAVAELIGTVGNVMKILDDEMPEQYEDGKETA